MQETVSKQQPKGDLTSASPAFSSLPENNLINVIKVRKLQLVWVFWGGGGDGVFLLLPFGF